MPGSVVDGEKEESSRKRPRSEDESEESGPKQTEQHGDSASIQSSSKRDNLPPPVFQVNYPFLRSSVKRLKKDPSPPPEPPPVTKKGGKDDYQKPVKAVKAERKRWEAWGNQDKTLFFEGLNEYGKDFEAIQKYIEHRQKKRGDPGVQVKNKDQVRHLYYRTCHKLFKYITPNNDQSKTVNELYALINYGELRKKIKGVIDSRTGQKLNELVNKGSTTIRYQQRNQRLRTPACKALKQLKARDEEDVEKPQKLPARVMVELTPKDNAAWTTVQGVAHNPRVRMVVPLRKELGSLLNMLSEKWTPHRIKLLQSMKSSVNSSEGLPHVKLQTLENAPVTPFDQLTGFYVHDKGRFPFYPGQTIVPVTKPAPKKKRGASKGTNDRNASPVQNEAVTSKHVSPVENETSSSKQIANTDVKPDQKCMESVKSPVQMDTTVENVEQNGIMDNFDTLQNDFTTIQSREWFNLALPTDFAPLPEMTEDFSVPVNQMDHTRIEVSNHRRKTEEESEKAEMGNGNNSKGDKDEKSKDGESNGSEDVEEKSSPVPQLPKDVRLKEGVTKENVGNLGITDVFLMLGMPKVLRLSYSFESSTGSNKPKLVDRLAQLAKTEFTEIVKPKLMVSVGVATSPTRSGLPPKTSETTPSKSSSNNHGKSPVSGRGSSGRGRHSANTPKSSRPNAPIIVSPATAAAAIAKACEARGGPDRPQSRSDKSVFLAPKPVAPRQLVAPRRITPTPAGGSAAGREAELFRAQLESIQRNADWQLPRKTARKPRGRRPLVVQRTLLPRPQSEDVRHMMTMSIVSNSSSKASTGQFMPMKIGDEIQSPKAPTQTIKQTLAAAAAAAGISKHNPIDVTTAASPNAMVSNTIMVSSLLASSPKSPATTPNNSHLNSPVASPLGQIFISSPVASPVEALSPAAMSPVALSPVAIEVTNAGSPLIQTSAASPLTQNALLTDPLLSTPPQASKLINSSTLSTPSPLLNRTTDGAAALTISPPNISSLLDISLPSAESASTVSTDALMDLGIGLSGFGQNPSSDVAMDGAGNSGSLRPSGTTTPPLTMTSPSSSPFKLSVSSLGPENQWLNGEVADISFSSILENLESPEKKDKSSTSVPTIAPPSPPPLTSPPPICPSPVNIFMENSRDSTLNKDVETHFQYMMNENSMDYVAKFADLAAHIAASAEPPKN